MIDNKQQFNNTEVAVHKRKRILHDSNG